MSGGGTIVFVGGGGATVLVTAGVVVAAAVVADGVVELDVASSLDELSEHADNSSAPPVKTAATIALFFTGSTSQRLQASNPTGASISTYRPLSRGISGKVGNADSA